MSGGGPHHPYRSGGDDLDGRIATLERGISQLGARIRQRYWTLLGPELRARFGRLLQGQRETSNERERELRLLHDDLRDAIEQAPVLEAEWTALPQHIDETALGERWPAGNSEVLLAGEWRDRPLSRLGSLAEQIARFVGRHDADAQILTCSRDVRAPCFMACSAPFALGAHHREVTGSTAFAIVTPVARACGDLRLDPMHWWSEIATRVGLQQDTFTGEASFDQRFLVRADRATAVRLLSQPLREALTKLSYQAPPRLRVAAGLARLHLDYHADEDLLTRAIELLAAIRHTPVAAELLDPG